MQEAEDVGQEVEDEGDEGDEEDEVKPSSVLTEVSIPFIRDKNISLKST